MKLYPEDYDVALEVQFVDLNNAAVVVQRIDAVLYDGDDQVLLEMDNLPFDAADTSKTITVPAALNRLGEGETSAARALRVVLTTDAGKIRRSFGYIIEGESRLELLNNTWVTLEAAEVLARDMPELKSWSQSSDEQRAAALINAYSRMQRIQLRFTNPLPGEEDEEDRCEKHTILRPGVWNELTADDFLAFPKPFRTALRRAQICEANSILTDNPFAERHRAGVISETVGESSVMLRGGKLELGVANETLRCLAGYVYYQVSIARA
jgi:hypothetical protein